MFGTLFIIRVISNLYSFFLFFFFHSFYCFCDWCDRGSQMIFINFAKLQISLVFVVVVVFNLCWHGGRHAYDPLFSYGIHNFFNNCHFILQHRLEAIWFYRAVFFFLFCSLHNSFMKAQKDLWLCHLCMCVCGCVCIQNAILFVSALA